MGLHFGEHLTRSDTARFRVRSGDFELEYEGPSDLVESRYVDALKLLEDKPPTTKAIAQENQKRGGRGGLRVNVISEALDGLIAEGWFKSKRSIETVVLELQNRKIPGVDKNNVRVALDRRVRSRKLKSIKDNGDWVYWTD
jgi:hypothetical protein